jgi:SPP1 family predicted phage head-tail adaptor
MLRNVITWQQESPTPDGSGGNAVTWTTFDADVPASVRPVEGLELFAGDQVQFRRTHLVTVRYNPSKIPTTAMRANFGGRLLYVVAVRRAPEEIGEWLEVDTEERSQD